MLIFLDTEFSDLIEDPSLISIGLVAENNQTFYGELSDTYAPSDCSEFSQEHVLPLLQGGEALMTRKELVTRLKSWIENFNEPVQIAVDSLQWDWTWILRVFNDATWPANLAKRPALLTMNYLFNFDAFEEAVEAAFVEGALRRHHALDDARANLIAYRASGGFE